MRDDYRFIQANGLKFAYIEEGKGPLVLCIHGFPDTPHTWDEVRPAIAELGYRVVTPFTRGYAPTEIPKDGPFDAETLGRDILALIEALGEKSAILVGHDWGASAAISAAALDPSRVRILVTVAIPHPAAIKPSPRLAWAVRHFVLLSLPGAASRVARNDFAHIDELVQRWSPTWNAPKDETRAVKKVFSNPDSLRAALGYYRALRPTPPASQRKKITVPSVAFAGLDDPTLSLDVYERARSRYTSSYEVISVRGGHFPHREDSQRFIEELQSYLKRQDPH